MFEFKLINGSAMLKCSDVYYVVNLDNSGELPHFMTMHVMGV